MFATIAFPFAIYRSPVCHIAQKMVNKVPIAYLSCVWGMILDRLHPVEHVRRSGRLDVKMRKSEAILQRIRNGALFLALAMVTTAAQAEWKVVSRAFAPQRVSVDLGTINRTGNLVALWTKVTPPPAPIGSDLAANEPSQAASPENVEGAPYLMQVSCSDRLIRLSTAAQMSAAAPMSADANPFGPADASPYTFQPLNNPVAYAVYSAVCSATTTPVVQAPPPDDPSLHITPRRTIAPRNPWPFTQTPGY